MRKLKDIMTASQVCHFSALRALLVIPLLIVLAGARGTCQQSSDAHLKSLFSQAQASQARGDYAAAAEKYAEVLKLRPDLAEVRANLGLMHHLLGKYPEAIRDFETALKAKPQLYVPNLFLGLDLVRTHQPQRALPYLQRALKLNPHDVHLALGLAQAYMDLHEAGKANEWYRRAAELSPGDSEAWYGQGITFLNLARAAAKQMERVGRGSLYGRLLYAESLEERGAIDDAVRTYERLLAALPSAPPMAHAALGLEYLVQGDPKRVADAQTQFAVALKGHPGCLLARLGVARVALQQGNGEVARKELAAAWDRDPNFVKANADRLWIGLKPDAVGHLAREIEQFPTNTSDAELKDSLTTALGRWRQEHADTVSRTFGSVGPHSQTASAGPSRQANLTPAQLFSQGRYSACSEGLRARRDLRPAELALLAECAFNSGDFSTSFEAGERLLRGNSDSLPGLYWKVRAAQKLAVAALNQAGLAELNSPRMHILLGQVYQNQSESRKAQAEYQKALALDPTSAAAHLGLATAYWQNNQKDRAMQELKIVLAGNPRDPDASYVMGSILVSEYKYEEAMPYLASALAGPADVLPQVHQLRSRVYAHRGELKQAVAELKKALSGDPDGTYHFQLANLYRRLGDKDAAAAALQESEKIRAARRN